MRGGGSRDESGLGLATDMPPPPTGPALTAALAQLQPVRTRVPARTLALLLAVQGLVAAVTLQAGHLRPDLPALPWAWVVGVGLIWAAAGPVLLVLAVLPDRGSVLPDPARAGRGALAIAAGLVLLGLCATVDAAGVTQVPASFWRAWWHCSTFALGLTLPVLLAAAVLLRHLHPVGKSQIAAAIGAAGGAGAGLILHLICPFGGGAHVGFAHGGAVLTGAGLGALGAWAPGRLLR